VFMQMFGKEKRIETCVFGRLCQSKDREGDGEGERQLQRG